MRRGPEEISARNEKIFTLNREGKNLQEIAKATGLSKSGVDYILKTHGVKCAHGVGRKPGRQKLPPATYHKALTLRAQGLTFAQIGQKLHCSRQAIFGMLRYWGRAEPPNSNQKGT